MKPHSGAASRVGVGAMRTTTTPATAPARNGIATTAIIHTGEPPESGSAPSSGSVGIAPSFTPVGATRVPVPMAKPGPVM